MAGQVQIRILQKAQLNIDGGNTKNRLTKRTP